MLEGKEENGEEQKMEKDERGILDGSIVQEAQRLFNAKAEVEKEGFR